MPGKQCIIGDIQHSYTEFQSGAIETTKYGRSSMSNVTRPANARIVDIVMEGGKKDTTEAAA
jgi:hypothetical protein